MMYTGERRWRREAQRIAAAVAVACVGIVVAGCGGDDGNSADAPKSGTPSTVSRDSGESLTMWTRAATEAQTQLLVDAYNKTHKNRVTLTVIPNDTYIQKVGQSAASGDLPDLFASDVVYAPNFATKSLWLDITGRIESLPFAADLAEAAVAAGTVDGKKYVVPHVIDTSVLFYNKGLYKKAGLDPARPPTTLKEFVEHARAITEYGQGNYGTYFGGNCGGCTAFTWWPSMWADGADVLNKEGTAANFTDPTALAVFDVFRQVHEEGLSAPGAKTETGATWVAAFTKGNIGVMHMPSSTLDTMPKKIDVGVAPIPGVKGGQSTFVGGDVLGVSADSPHPDQAWNFIEWTLSEKAQVEILAKSHYQLARTDLSSNQYTSSDERLVTINSVLSDGQTPIALNFGQTFNDPNGPWLSVVRDAVFGDRSKLEADNEAVSASLAGG
jgi:multiple sugar transport system substrate-binding protein